MNDQTMNTRDYFAAQAMTMIPYSHGYESIQFRSKHFKQYTELMAEAAYQIADAMMKARGEKELEQLMAWAAAKAKEAS